jgi:hypothetical protein
MFTSLSLLKKSIVILKDDDYEIYSKCDDCICIVYDSKKKCFIKFIMNIQIGIIILQN